MVDRAVSERLKGSCRRDTVSIDNCLRVDLLVDEFLGLAQELGSKDGDGGGAITNLVVLNFRDIDEDFGRGVIESYGFEDCGTVIGHHDLSGRAMCRDSLLGRFRGRRVISGVCMDTHADCSILSIPFGPSVVFTRSPTAIAPTNADSPVHHTNCQSHTLKLCPQSFPSNRTWARTY